MDKVILEKNGPIATITINNPKALNALSTEVLTDLEEAIDAVAADEAINALILTGAGRSFVAGADIAEMKDKNAEEAREYGAFGNRIFRKIETLPIAVIAAVNGFALGGGNELAMSADIRLASKKAKFGQPEVGLGITPGFGGTQRLARIIPVGKAKELIYTGKTIGADEALAIGLVNTVYEPEELMDEAVKLANTIAANAPLAVAASKKAINDGIEMPIEEGIDVEITEFANCFNTEDQTYGMEYFLDRNKDKPAKKFNKK